MYARDEVTYENRWVNGINFVIAKAGDRQVAVAMWRDCLAVSAMIQDKMRAKSTAFQAMTTTLMRTYTLAPQSYYGGMVYFENRKAKQYQLYVPWV